MGINQRSQVAMTAAEIEAFIPSRRTATLVTLGRTGHPHAVAMWFAVIDGVIWFETKAKAQKAVNIRRDPRATVLVEDGLTYDSLRGVSARRAVHDRRRPRGALGRWRQRVGALQRPLHRRGRATRRAHAPQPRRGSLRCRTHALVGSPQARPRPDPARRDHRAGDRHGGQLTWGDSRCRTHARRARLPHHEQADQVRIQGPGTRVQADQRPSRVEVARRRWVQEAGAHAPSRAHRP